jgi:hypothetical protein
MIKDKLRPETRSPCLKPVKFLRVSRSPFLAGSAFAQCGKYSRAQDVNDLLFSEFPLDTAAVGASIGVRRRER